MIRATWVLLEGASDVAAVRALRAGRGVAPADEPCELIDMGGATNVRRYLGLAAEQRALPRVIGLCDEREAHYFARGVAAHSVALGIDVEVTVEELPRLGFQICRRDLEDELMRALGVDGTLAVLDEVELRTTFEGFTRQLVWRGRPVRDQLRRFVGTTSGRKELLAGAMAAALADESIPAPLAGLLASMERLSDVSV
ncbi:hypothetical protein N802_18600 [Knoellia sinensis KCTC 19936]|uniref:ATP-dependent endonuclease n=1 Tax=Knoellia sinensis KCTC 19936 TaxID=1385520 RepID=A0A0A0J9U1_9MICO|nr:hypothetical protein [Knoellia sinensis]KGN32376.1 hypothetical protein N802_18600 [Knoellia sinensis KCTC 19936]